MTGFSDDEIRAKIEGWGVPLDYIFLISKGEEDKVGLIGVWFPQIGIRMGGIEQVDLAIACYNYLERRGAKRFSSELEALQFARANRWPGWDMVR